MSSGKEYYDDPSMSKGQLLEPSSAYAQPVASPTTIIVGGGTYATPSSPRSPNSGWNQYNREADYTAPPYAQDQPQMVATQVVRARNRPAIGRWADSICDWPSNLFPSCYCVCCCCYGMWLIGQMSQKTGFASFQFVIWMFLFIWLVAIILQAVIGAGFLIWLPLVFAFGFSIWLRMHIVRKYNITELGSGAFGCFGEFCCGFCCWYCSVAQMARHLYGYNKILDGDGDIERPDQYLSQQV